MEQQFDLIYAQSGYLYIILLDDPRVSTYHRNTSGASHAVDGIIGSVSHHPQHHEAPPIMPQQPRNTTSVAHPNQAPDYYRMMSHSRPITFYAQPVPQQHVHAPT